jgi:hypothetical protein
MLKKEEIRSELVLIQEKEFVDLFTDLPKIINE